MFGYLLSRGLDNKNNPKLEEILTEAEKISKENPQSKEQYIKAQSEVDELRKQRKEIQKMLKSKNLTEDERKHLKRRLRQIKSRMPKAVKERNNYLEQYLRSKNPREYASQKVLSEVKEELKKLQHKFDKNRQKIKELKTSLHMRHRNRALDEDIKRQISQLCKEQEEIRKLITIKTKEMNLTKEAIRTLTNCR